MCKCAHYWQIGLFIAAVSRIFIFQHPRWYHANIEVQQHFVMPQGSELDNLSASGHHLQHTQLPVRFNGMFVVTRLYIRAGNVILSTYLELTKSALLSYSSCSDILKFWKKLHPFLIANLMPRFHPPSDYWFTVAILLPCWAVSTAPFGKRSTLGKIVSPAIAVSKTSKFPRRLLSNSGVGRRWWLKSH